MILVAYAYRERLPASKRSIIFLAIGGGGRARADLKGGEKEETARYFPPSAGR